MTSAQIALAWMMDKHPFIVPLFGTTKLSHLEEDLRTADFTLTPDEIKELEAKVSAFPSWALATMPNNRREWNIERKGRFRLTRCSRLLQATSKRDEFSRGNP